MIGKLLGPEKVHLKEWREPPGRQYYIRRFYKKRNELPDATDTDILSTFTYGTTNKALVHELGHMRPRTTVDLLNIATKFTGGEDVVGAIFERGRARAMLASPVERKGTVGTS